MANAINYLKMHIAQTDGMSEDEAKQYLCLQLDTFLEERIIAAAKLIAHHGASKIQDGDVILTHARYATQYW
jgi:translation initiation factor eIF-2B subunit delta